MKKVILYSLLYNLGFGSFAQNSREIMRMAMNHELPIDTSYLPIDRFKYKYMDRQLTDSIGAFFFIQYLKALDEPPIYCCEPDTIIRVLTIYSFEPATVVKFYKQNDNFLIEQKIANKIQFDTSHYDPSKLDKKELRKWWKVYRAGPNTKEDSILLARGFIKDTTEYNFKTEMVRISQSQWNSIFNSINKDFYQMITVPDDDGGVVADGTMILIEANTKLGYHVLSRELNSTDERQLSTLVWKINQLIED